HKDGAIITNIQANSPAQRANLKRGDLIYAINDKEVKDPHSLQRIVTAYRPEDTITLSIEREGKEIKQELKLSSMHGEKLALSSVDQNFDGLYLNKLNEQNREKFQVPTNIIGVIIEDVDQGSKAYSDGFMSGDIIIQIENRDIRTLEDVTKAFRDYKGKTKRIYINRRGAILLMVTR
ncbi:MAG: PDZ domain-containing protein, partial [Epsilonproteobacteria bacterium]|nr:PDZ domain-containing protein [Campylobacterota bacterium]